MCPGVLTLSSFFFKCFMSRTPVSVHAGSEASSTAESSADPGSGWSVQERRLWRLLESRTVNTREMAQVLRAHGATRAGPGYRVHRGPLDRSSSFCWSPQKEVLQQLNGRLASYLQQVQRLETANQRLERQIQEELDRKCPGELGQLDGYLRTASLLQVQISECLSAQAQVKLQLLSAELTVFDFNVRCEKERERGICVEAELNDLRLLEEVLKVDALPELQTLLNDQTQQLMELQMQHRQDMQGLLAQVSGGVAVEIRSTSSSDLIQQLDDLRRTSVTLNESRFTGQASMLSSPEAGGSEVVRAELEQLRRTAAALEEELTRLQALNVATEASGLQQTESFVQQLVDLQCRADGLCRDLDLVLQAAARQAADHQVLLGIKTRLQAEIQDYWRLLDGGVSSLHSNSNVISFCGTTSPAAFRRNITVNKSVRVQGGNLIIMRAQNVPRGHAHTVRQTPGKAPRSETVTTVQPIRVYSKHPKRSPVSLINTSNLTGSFHMSDNQRSGSPSTTVNQRSSTGEDEVHGKDSDAAQGIPTLVQQSARGAAVQTKPETSPSKQATTEAGLHGYKTNIQTEITETILCAEPGVKEGTCFVTPTATTDPSKESSAEVKKEPETITPDQMICTEGSFQIKNQDPAQVVTLSLETSAEADGDAEEAGVTASVVSGPPLRAEDTQGKVSGELTLINDKNIVNKGEEEEVESTWFNASKSEPNKVMEDADTGSSCATASSGSPDCKDNHESEIASTEILKKVEFEMNKGKAISGLHDAHKVKVDSTELDNEIVDLTGQEESNTKSKQSVSLTDSGVALSSSDHEEILSPIEAHVFMGPPSPPSPETCLSPVETEAIMTIIRQGFCPVDPEDHVQNPDSLLSPRDPEMFFSPNDSDTCLSPVEAQGCLSPNAEEDEDECMSLTEARTHVRPVEKYILSTKEEGQSLSFSTDQALPEEDRNREVSISAGDGDSLCFRSFESNDGSKDTLNGTNTNSRPSGRKLGLQLSSSLGGFEFGGPGGRSIIADKEKELGFGGLYRKSESDKTRPRDGYKETSGIADIKYVQNLSGSPGGRYGSGDQKETSLKDSEVMGQKNSAQVFVKSASFGCVPANAGTTSQSQGSGMVSYLAASCGGKAANSSPIVNSNAEAEVQGRFRRSSGDWIVYSGSLGHTSSTRCKESPSGATPLGASRPETGRSGSRGSGEWTVYGLGRKRSLDGEKSLASEEEDDGPSVFTTPATSPGQTGRFNSRGSGEWMPYGGSLGRKSSLPKTGSEESPAAVKLPATGPPDSRRPIREGSGERSVHSGILKRSDSLPITGSRESQSAATHLPTSPPKTGRFGSRGSGEWRVYGGSTGRLSRVAASNSLPNAVGEESLLVARQLATSPPGAPRAPRFGSGDSGEWRVYGGTGNRDRVSVSANYRQVISPPSSYTSSGPRLAGAGSAGSAGSVVRRSSSVGSAGSVVRRSSSVGSGGRLRSSGSGSQLSSSPGSHVTSSSGRFGSTGSGESKPVYGSASGRSSTVGNTGQSGGGRTTSSQRAPSPGGSMSVGSAGWPSRSAAGGNGVGSGGSGSKLSGTGDRISSRVGGRISGSAGSGRTNSSGRRVISSSDRPIRSTGSGAGGNRERISVCKMAALSISAAGRGRSQEQQQQQQAQWSKEQQQAAAPSPLVQRWLTTGVGVTSDEPDSLDDIMRL